MKKLLAVIAVVTVVCAAGAAFAKTHGHDESRRMPHQIQQDFSGEREPRDQRRPEGFDGAGCRFGRGHKPGKLGITPDMPEEIRAKVVEAAKLKIDLEAVFAAKPLDKAKAMDIFGKIQQAENEVKMWKFGKRLEMMEAFRTQKELNRKIPPAHKPEKPAPKTEAPAPEE